MIEEGGNRKMEGSVEMNDILLSQFAFLIIIQPFCALPKSFILNPLTVQYIAAGVFLTCNTKSLKA
jgi:hypothetical protein